MSLQIPTNLQIKMWHGKVEPKNKKEKKKKKKKKRIPKANDELPPDLHGQLSSATVRIAGQWDKCKIEWIVGDRNSKML